MIHCVAAKEQSKVILGTCTLNWRQEYLKTQTPSLYVCAVRIGEGRGGEEGVRERVGKTRTRIQRKDKINV